LRRSGERDDEINENLQPLPSETEMDEGPPIDDILDISVADDLVDDSLDRKKTAIKKERGTLDKEERRVS